MEYTTKGSLYDFLRTEEASFLLNESMVTRIAIQIVQGKNGRLTLILFIRNDISTKKQHST